MFAGFCPVKACFNAESISEGKMLTAPNTIAHSSTITSSITSTGKNSLLCFITFMNSREKREVIAHARVSRFAVYQFHQLNDILAASWTKIHQVVLFKTNDSFVPAGIGQCHTRNIGNEFFHATHLIKAEISGYDD